VYLPKHFAETDRSALLAIVRANPFATLVTMAGGLPQAGHVPLVAAEQADGALVLRGHLAAGNPQLDHEGPALAVFHGPHAYISAAWYDADDTVPTWNYQVVHARGELRVDRDPAALDQLLDHLAAAVEGPAATRWQERLGSATRSRLLKQIVAIELRVADLVGKSKLSQQHAPERRARAVAALRRAGGDQNLAVAAAMARTLAGDGGGGGP
jgi:transcriptional regulator